MSTLEARAAKRTSLPKFKSTHPIHPRSGRNPTTHPKSNLSAYFPSPGKQDPHLLSQTMIETNLPEITSRKSSQKRSSYLEMWLDEALNPQEKTGSQSEPVLRVGVDKTGPLRTVQKFQIDKNYLRSQNISLEAIEKVYSSLYVYTYGINHTFEQIMALTKTGEHADKKVIDTFWNAFIRLLEGCTSFRTTFQVIEEGHIKAKVELKDVFLRREQEWLDQKMVLQEENLRQLKQLGDLNLTLSKMSTDYNISEATLLMTDQAFNEEVSTRLKFEEKVNAMFNSYDELRGKYNHLVNELRQKEEQERETRQRENKMRMDIELFQIRREEGRKQLLAAQKGVQQREQELAIRRQEIFELSDNKNRLSLEKEQNEEEVRKIVTKVGHFRQLSQEYLAESQSKGIMLKELQKRVSCQDDELGACRNAQQRLYEQLKRNGSTISSLQERLLEQGYQINETNQEREGCMRLAEKTSEVNATLSATILLQESELGQTRGELALKDSLIEKNKGLLAELRAVNAKLEVLFKATNAEKLRIEGILHKTVEISQRFKEEMTGMRMLLDNKTVELDEAEMKLCNERDVFRSKIASLKDDIETKEQKVLAMHSQHVAGHELVTRAEQETNGLRRQQQQLQDQILNLEAEGIQRNSKIEALSVERTKKGSLLQEMEHQLEVKQQERLQYKQALELKEGLLGVDKDHAIAESQLMSQLLDGYRRDRQRKVCYVHPMLYEDALQQIDRLTLTRNQLRTTLEGTEQEIGRIRKSSEEEEQRRGESAARLEEALRSVVEREEQLSTVRHHCKNLQTQLLQLDESKRGLPTLEQVQNQQEQLRKYLRDNLRLQKEVEEKDCMIGTVQQTVACLAQQNQRLTVLIQQLQQGVTLSQQTELDLQERNFSLTKNHSELISAFKQLSCDFKREEAANQQKPTLASQEVQTDKKFSHLSKFEVPQTGDSVSCQVSPQEIDECREERRVGRGDVKKVESTEFRRALKITYMRR